jgi:hypothetical protein
MFRLIAILLMTVLIADRARTIFATGRTLGDPGYAKASDPLGYWAVASSYACAAFATTLGTAWLIYCALVGGGPYSRVPFFSAQGQTSLILVSLVLALAIYLTFAKRVRRLITAAPRLRRKTLRQKRRRK